VTAERPGLTFSDLPTSEDGIEVCECKVCSRARKASAETGKGPLSLWRVRAPDSHRGRPMYFSELVVAAHSAEQAMSVHPLSTEAWWTLEYGDKGWLSCGRPSAWESWHLPHDLSCEQVGTPLPCYAARDIVTRW